MCAAFKKVLLNLMSNHCQEQFLTILCCLFVMIGGKKMNFHQHVMEHKDIKKAVDILTSAVSSQRGQVNDNLKQFNLFRAIWDDDRNLKVKV